MSSATSLVHFANGIVAINYSIECESVAGHQSSTVCSNHSSLFLKALKRAVSIPPKVHFHSAIDIEFEILVCAV